MGQEQQERYEALRQARAEIAAIEAAYFLREPPKPRQPPRPKATAAPKKPVPVVKTNFSSSEARRRRRRNIWIGIGAFVLFANIPAVKHWSENSHSTPTPCTQNCVPWYCNGAGVGGDNAARALRDCPETAGYRAQLEQENAYFVAHGLKPLPAPWADLPDSSTTVP